MVTSPPTREAPQDVESAEVAPVVIKPSHGLRLDLPELWARRELLYFLVWRDFKVRYRQTALGVVWAVVQPVTAMIVFSVVFGRLARLPSDNIPYPIFTFAALLPWNFFATAVSRSTGSIVSNAGLITKVYFPRLIVPMTAAAAGALDFLISFVVMLAMMFYYGLPAGPRILAVPLFMALAFATALGIGLWLSAVNVRYRDVTHLIPFVLQLWLYASPVAYSGSLIPERWRLLYGLNPMTGVVEGFRWAVLQTPWSGSTIWASIAVALAVLGTGLVIFGRMEKTFADIV